MNKFIVAIFPDETKAYEGSRCFKDLDAEGSLALYGLAVIAKDAKGNMSVRQAADEGPIGTGVGALVGSLVGLLGGPVGAAIGLGSGALLGSLGDLYTLGVSAEFLDKVSRELTPGKTAVVAEVSEDWVTPLDTRMQAIGGVVIREWRFEAEAELARANAAATKAELAQLQAEFAQAKNENKAKLPARIDEVQAKARAASDRLKSRIDQAEREAGAKIDLLEQQVGKAKGDAKAKLDLRISDMRTDRERRSGLLKEAWTLTKEALELREGSTGEGGRIPPRDQPSGGIHAR